MTGRLTMGLPALALAVALLLGLFAPLAGPRTAAAHPLGNFTVNRYARIELYRGVAVVHYVLDFAEIPAFQLSQEIDHDGDGHLGEAEIAAFLPRLAGEIEQRISFRSGPERLDLVLRESSGAASEGQGSLEVLRVALVFVAEVPEGADREFLFEDGNYSDWPGWREIVVRPSTGAAADVEPRFFDDRSDALRAYPEDGGTASDAAVAFTWDPATGAAAAENLAPEEGSANVRGDRFSGLLDNDRSLGIILLSLAAAFGFGALHALGPGHGKSVVAAYLVGSRGTARHALALGVTVTATHTAAVYLLGSVTLIASDLVAPERLFLYLGVASGALIVAMGLALSISRLRALRKRPDGHGLHRHGLFGKAHSHLPADGHAVQHDDAGDACEHGHHDGPSVTWRGLITLGIAGGILPCPSALVVMLAAISLGQVVFGMLLIVAFSVGLAGVLVTIGLALVLGRRLSGRAGVGRLAKSQAAMRLARAVPLVSAFAVTLAGAAITYQAWNQPGL